MPQFTGSVLVLLALLGSMGGAAAAAAAFTDGGGCEVSALAADVAASCAARAVTPPCCEPVLASVELGGGACLCRLALETSVLQAGLNGYALAALYAGCGGGAAIPLAACHGAPPSGSSVLALPSAGAGAHLAGVANDRVGGAPEFPSTSVSPTHEVIRMIRSLSSDDRETVQATTVTNVIGVFLWLIIAVFQVCRCIYGRKG